MTDSVKESEIKMIADGEHKEILNTEWGPLYPVNLKGQLPEYFNEIAEEKIGETPQRRQEALKLLKEFIRETNAYHDLPEDDDILMMFLRTKKFHIVKAFALLKNFYEHKRNHFDQNTFDLEEMENMLNLNFIGILPYRDLQGKLVVLAKAASLKIENDTLDPYINMIVQYGSKVIEDPVTQICGVTLILDLAKMDWKLLKFVNKRNVSLLADLAQNCFPARFKAAHLVNEPFIVKLLYKTFKVFISKKYQKRIHFHGKNYEELYDYYPPSCLPVEYGGTIEKFGLPYSVKDVLNPKLLSF